MKNKLSYGAIGALLILTGCGVKAVSASMEEKSIKYDTPLTCTLASPKFADVECYTPKIVDGEMVAQEVKIVRS